MWSGCSGGGGRAPVAIGRFPESRAEPRSPALASTPSTATVSASAAVFRAGDRDRRRSQSASSLLGGSCLRGEEWPPRDRVLPRLSLPRPSPSLPVVASLSRCGGGERVRCLPPPWPLEELPPWRSRLKVCLPRSTKPPAGRHGRNSSSSSSVF